MQGCGMSWRKDLKSQPKKGRYFPIRFGDAARLIKDLELVQYDGGRLAIKMENIDGEFKNGHLIVDVMPEEDIAVYSLPIEVDERLAEKAAVKSLVEIAKVQKKISNFDNSKYSYYCAYIKGVSEIVITRKDISKQKGKYRGDSKFSNAFKTKKVNRDETILSTINI